MRAFVAVYIRWSGAAAWLVRVPVDGTPVAVGHCWVAFRVLDKIIDKMIRSLKRDFDLNVEGTVEAFLGVEVMDHKKGRLARQSGLTERVISAVNMTDANSAKTPATMMGLGDDVGGAPRKEHWSYSSVLGMLL